MRRFTIQFLTAACLLTSAPLSCFAEQALIAVASNFSSPARAIALAFEQESGHSVRLSQGSSGKLYAQIYNGAPFDVFLSADTENPRCLLKKDSLSRVRSEPTRAARWHSGPLMTALLLMQRRFEPAISSGSRRRILD